MEKFYHESRGFVKEKGVCPKKGRKKRGKYLSFL
jgi:hypothetical protein